MARPDVILPVCHSASLSRPFADDASKQAGILIFQEIGGKFAAV